MSASTEIAEQLAVLSIRLRNRKQNLEAEMETINTVVRSLGETGLIRHDVLLGPTFERPYAPEARHDDSCQIVQAALLVPEGFGVCYWDMEEFVAGRRSPDGLEADARLHFQRFEQCTIEEKAFLGSFIRDMLEDLHDTAIAAASRLERGSDLSVEDYFGRRNGGIGENAP